MSHHPKTKDNSPFLKASVDFGGSVKALLAGKLGEKAGPGQEDVARRLSADIRSLSMDSKNRFACILLHMVIKAHSSAGAKQRFFCGAERRERIHKARKEARLIRMAS
jgi:hypothetical protein